MKKTLILLATVIALAVSCAPKDVICVMSYNIRQSGAKDGENCWENRKPATDAMINSLKPDLIGTQELCLDQLEYIVDKCPAYDYVGVGRDNGIHKGEHMAIFYLRSKFELLDSRTIWLSETPDTVSYGWDAACRRTATITYLRHKPTGKDLYFVNTHLDHKGLVAQKEGLALIVSYIDSLNTTGAPMLLTGDFNVIPSNPALEDLNLRMKSARNFAEVSDKRGSFNGWKKPLAEAALGDNLKGYDPEKLTIDYIYYSGFSSCPKFETVTTTFADVPFISDHYPVRAYLKF